LDGCLDERLMADLRRMDYLVATIRGYGSFKEIDMTGA